MKNTLKTKLLKKWRREANLRIGVFERDNGRFIIVFDKSWYGSVSNFRENYDKENMKLLKRQRRCAITTEGNSFFVRRGRNIAGTNLATLQENTNFFKNNFVFRKKRCIFANEPLIDGAMKFNY